MSALDIPYLTLLDLDTARFQGGWGRIKYAVKNKEIFEPTWTQQFPRMKSDSVPEWNNDEYKILSPTLPALYCNHLANLEQGSVFFSYPMDLDFAMLLAYPDAYGVEREKPDEATTKAVLGKSHHDASQYSVDEQKLFNTYHQRFKLGSKPAAHIGALAQLTDEVLLADMPASLSRLADAVIAKLTELPE